MPEQKCIYILVTNQQTTFVRDICLGFWLRIQGSNPLLTWDFNICSALLFVGAPMHAIYNAESFIGPKWFASRCGITEKSLNLNVTYLTVGE